MLGILGTGPSGANCLRNTLLTRPAIAASSNGCGEASWNISARAGRGVARPRETGTLELEEAFIGASFTGAKKGASPSNPRRGKGTKIIAITDGHSLPLAVNDRAASRGAAPTDPRTAAPWGDTANAGEWNDSWLHHFRRLVIRWEYHVENFLGMVRLGCMHILLRY